MLIPPLDRIFRLMGANVQVWYDEMPKAQKHEGNEAKTASNKSLTPTKGSSRMQKIHVHFQSHGCILCEGDAIEGRWFGPHFSSEIYQQLKQIFAKNV